MRAKLTKAEFARIARERGIDVSCLTRAVMFMVQLRHEGYNVKRQDLTAWFGRATNGGI